MINCYKTIGGNSNLNVLENYPYPKKLDDNLQNLFKEKANLYQIDWKWLAAFSWQESKWGASKKNKLRYSYTGLFQYNKDSIGRGHDNRILTLDLDADQTEAAARDIKQNKDIGLTYGLSEYDSYLYAAIAHNAGPTAAKWAAKYANPKTIAGMQDVLLHKDGGYGPHAIKAKWFSKKTPDEADRQSREKAQFPIQIHSVYQWLIKHGYN